MSTVVVFDAPFVLESGAILPEVRLAYHTWGELNDARDNVVWVLHALTGSSDATSWWPDIVGSGRPFDPSKHFIVCANMIGSCYGSTGPTHIDPSTGAPWYHTFPLVTNRDIVRAFQLLRDHLGIDRIDTVIGGSMGGQQALEWGVQEHDRINRLIVIAANDQHSPWGVAFNAAQRMSIEADQTFQEARPDAGQAGLSAARATAMLSYRSAGLYNSRQRTAESLLTGYRAESYQRHQGSKLVQRFSAHSYYGLTRTMDAHDIGRDRGGAGAALRTITSNTLVVGISTDTLFPVYEQHFIADMIPHAKYRTLLSSVGHDAFLTDQQHLATLI
ncbi:MAG: homoserine O-acetyltransferase [Ignavibacteriae bacterium]|nr:MAG: homoserine O-acetyltransferase [Ignavibacteriota bacterium]